MRRSNATTLQDIAQEAGVTAMAASVVLNGASSSTRVSENTRKRILEVAERLRYRRNAVARGLSRRRMDSLGVVAVVDGGELNLYFLEVLNGILGAAAEKGQNTTVFSIKNWEDEDRILEFCDGRVDGMILLAPQRLTPEFVVALQRRLAYVTIHGNCVVSPTHNLDVDNEGGAYAVTQHLIERGHRRIAHFPGRAGLGGADQRRAGYQRALREAGIAADPALVFEGDFSLESGRLRARALLEQRGLELPTAIFCASDAIAMGCMERLAAAGIGVPGDVSIAGFDDILSARMTIPPLTTVRQPFRQMGETAVDLLVAQLSGSTSGPISDCPPREVVFPAELVFRGSVGPPRIAFLVAS